MTKEERKNVTTEKKEKRQPMSEKECKFAAEKVRNHIQKASENVVDLKLGGKTTLKTDDHDENEKVSKLKTSRTWFSFFVCEIDAIWNSVRRNMAPDSRHNK